MSSILILSALLASVYVLLSTSWVLQISERILASMKVNVPAINPLPISIVLVNAGLFFVLVAGLLWMKSRGIGVSGSNSTPPMTPPMTSPPADFRTSIDSLMATEDDHRPNEMEATPTG